MRLLINAALTAIFSFGLLAVLTAYYRRSGGRAIGGGGTRRGSVERTGEPGIRQLNSGLGSGRIGRNVAGVRRSFVPEFLFGVLAAIVVVLARALVGTTARHAPTAVMLLVGAAALTEEAGKLAALGLCRIRREPPAVRETIAAGAAVGLGFALVENSWYIADATLLLLVRGVTAVPLHAVTAGFLGWGLTSPLRPARVLTGFAAAVLLHAAYNAMIVAGGLLAPSTVVLVGAGAALLLTISQAAD